MPELLTFMLGLFLAALVTGACGVFCWQRERMLRARGEAYNRINDNKISRLEKLQEQAEETIKEKDRLLAMSAQQLQQAGATMAAMGQRIRQLESPGNAQAMFMGLKCGDPNCQKCNPTQAVESDDEDEDSDITGLN